MSAIAGAAVDSPMTDAQLDPLFSSAEAFLRMWESCEARGAALVAGDLLDASIPRLA